MRRLNLRNYSTIEKEDASLEITFSKDIMKELALQIKDNPDQPPVLHLRGRPKVANTNIAMYDDMKAGTVKWNKAIAIEDDCSPEKYAELVEWWYEEASKDRSYADSINDRFYKLEDIKGAMMGLKDWLTGDCAYTVNASGGWLNRKSHLNKFITNRLQAKMKQMRDKNQRRR